MTAPGATPPPTDILDAKFVKSVPLWKKKDLPPLPQIAIVGRSNVGKSSLINAMTNRIGLAKTSCTPGRTQHIVLFEAQMRQEGQRIPFHLVDLPGYGYAEVPLEMRGSWAPMMNSYFANNQHIVCLVLLLDIRRAPNEQDLELLEMAQENEIPIVPVATKIDKFSRNQRGAELKKIAAALELEHVADLHRVSLTEKIGVPPLMADLFELLKERAAGG